MFKSPPRDKRSEHGKEIFADIDPGQLLKRISTHVVLLSVDGTIRYLNFASPGFALEDVIGRNAVDFLAKSSRETFTGTLREVVESGVPREVELEDIKGRSYSCRFSVERPGSDVLLSVATDITDRRRMEAALQLSEQRQRDVLDNVDEIVFALSPEGRIEYLNEAVRTVTGFDPDELVGERFHKFIHPEDIPRVEEGLLAALHGEPRPDEYRVRTKDGSYRWLRSKSRSVTRDGRVAGLRGVATDITEYRLADSARSEAEENYRSLFENAAFGIYRSSVDGRFQYVNSALVRMLGYETKDDVLDLDLAADVYLLPDERERFISAVMGEERFDGLKVDWKRKDGSVIQVRLSGRVVRGTADSLDGFEVIAEDVTEEETLEEQRRHAQKMEAIGRLAGGMAHDFNNLLTVINGHTDLLATGLAREPKHQEHLVEIQRAGERAAALTSQLLTFSRRQLVQPRVLDLGTLVSESTHTLSRILGENIEMITEVHSGPSEVMADPAQILQVLTNLVLNAREAMPKGGTIRIRTSAVTLYERLSAQPESIPPGTYLVMSCSDTGAGIPDAIKTNIFEPFFTTKEAQHGTGLGLSAVYGIVQQWGGFLEVSSRTNEGAIFRVYLPLVEDLEERPSDGEKSSASASGGAPNRCAGASELVLLVEDNDAVRMTAEAMLHSLGYEVVTARNGEDALRVSRTAASPFSLVLTDVVMPGMSGPELAALLQDRWPELKVILMTGYADEAVLGTKARGSDVVLLKKPFTTASLDLTLRRVLEI